jgi:hypothetical protein
MITCVETKWARGLLPVLTASLALFGCDAVSPPDSPAVTTVRSALTINQAKSVMTQKNDLGRSGANLNETSLAPSNVSNSKLGRLYTRQVVGSILTQPLYLNGIDMGSLGIRNVVLVTTSSNYIYAFDADDTTPDPGGLLWKSAGLGVPNTPSGECFETRWTIGITSTPVFDPATGALFVVSRTTNGCTQSIQQCDSMAKYMLLKINVQTGVTMLSTEITASSVVAADGGSPVSFDPTVQLNRPGLLLMNGVVYSGFGTLNCDGGDYHGWIFGHRTSDLVRVAAFSTSSPNQKTGIWQSGQGLAGDPVGKSIFVFTANGQSASTYGDSALRLTVGATGALSVAASYVPTDQGNLDCSDTDLGAGGPMLLPGGKLIGGGKQGVFYLLGQTGLTPTRVFQAANDTWHLQGAANPTICADAAIQTCPPGITGVLEQLGCYIPPVAYQYGESLGPNIHGGPSFWADTANHGYVYLASEKDYLKAFSYTTSTGDVVCAPGSTGSNCLPSLTSQSVRGPNGMPGGFTSISANGQTNGIVWVSEEKKHGQWVDAPSAVVASDAATLKELWRDNSDVPFTKFMPVTVAGGKVFRATMAPTTADPTSLGELVVYGALPAATWSASTIGGPGFQFVANSRGQLFALTPDKQTIVAYRGYGNNWTPIGGPASGLYAGGSTLFATDPGNGSIRRWDNPVWTQVGNPGKTFAVDDHGTLYGLTPDQQGVFQYTGTGQNWTQISGAAGALWAGGNYLFATWPTGDVYRFGPEAARGAGDPDQWIWRQAGGPVSALAADDTGRLYGLTSDKTQVNAYNGWDLSWRTVGGPATGIAAGGQRLFAISGGVVSVFDEGINTSWISTGVTGNQVIARGELVAAVDPSTGNLKRLTLGPARPWQRVQIGTPGAQFAIDSIGTIYGLTTNLAGVFKYAGVFETDDARRLAWTQVTGAATSIIAGGSRLYTVDPTTANIMRYDGTLTPTTIGGPGAQFVADDVGNLYALPTDRQGVYQYSGSGTTWTWIGGPASALYAGGNKLYETDPATGNLLVYNGTPNSWTVVGPPSAMFGVDGNGTAYALTASKQAVTRLDGQTWTTIGGAAGSIIVGGGTVMAFDSAINNLYHYDTTLNTWDFVAAGVGKLVVGGDVVLGVDRVSGNVYRYWRP